MSLREDLEAKMHDAMRNKDDLTRDTIRMVFSAIKQAEVESRTKLEDPEIQAILQKEVKIRNETITELSGTNRSDLIDKAKSEMSLLNNFLPKQLSDDEIRVIAQKVIAEVTASGLSDMGKVMKSLLPLVKGQALPDRVSKVVKDLLNG
jgi:uncharacterized protein YqeY